LVDSYITECNEITITETFCYWNF